MASPSQTQGDSRLYSRAACVSLQVEHRGLHAEAEAARAAAPRPTRPRAGENPGIGTLSPKPAVRSLDADAITLPMKRGEQLVEAGDLAAARTLFQRVAEADDAAAAT